MDITKTAHKVVKAYVSDFPEVRNNAYRYFNYDNRVVEERVERGDPKLPYYAPKDFTDGMFDVLVASAVEKINPILAKYSPRIACEDAMHMAIRDTGNGFFDGLVNANTFNTLINAMLSMRTAKKKKKDSPEEKELRPNVLKMLKLKRKDVPRLKGTPRKEEMSLVQEKGRVKLRKRGR